MAIGITWLTLQTVFVERTVEWFISISMVLLGLQKLQDVERFATMFLNYDLLAQRWIRYGYVYPFVETGAGLLMMVGVMTWLSAPAALIVASIGAISVFKAVYIDKRELICACVGGDSKRPIALPAAASPECTPRCAPPKAAISNAATNGRTTSV